MRFAIRTLAAASVSLIAVSAQAADLPSSKMSPAAPIFLAYNWTGFYVGLQGGYQWGRNRHTIAGAVVDGVSYDPKGWMFGGHVGYNVQVNQLVFGFEGDVEWTNTRATGAYPGAAAPFSHRTRIDWQGSLRGRFGFAFDRALIYLTGGAAFANIKHNINSAPNINYSDTRFGWTIGAGLEYALTNNITARGEYRYTDYGRSSNTVAVPAALSFRDRVSTHAVRLGVSYKF